MTLQCKCNFGNPTSCNYVFFQSLNGRLILQIFSHTDLRLDSFDSVYIYTQMSIAQMIFLTCKMFEGFLDCIFFTPWSSLIRMINNYLIIYICGPNLKFPAPSPIFKCLVFKCFLRYCPTVRLWDYSIISIFQNHLYAAT